MSGDEVPVPVVPLCPVVLPLPVVAAPDVVPPAAPPVAPPVCAKADTLVIASAVARPSVANFIAVSLSHSDEGQMAAEAIVPDARANVAAMRCRVPQRRTAGLIAAECVEISLHKPHKVRLRPPGLRRDSLRSLRFRWFLWLACPAVARFASEGGSPSRSSREGKARLRLRLRRGSLHSLRERRWLAQPKLA